MIRATPLTQNIRPRRAPLNIAQYEAAGGYQALRKALAMSPMDIQREVVNSNLRGRGGAGFSTGKKWGIVPMGEHARRPKYLVVNADEMEPGTMKDRLLMEGDPHAFLEGVIISAYAIEANVAIIFLRWEYKLSAQRIVDALAEAYDRKYLGRNILGSPYSLELHLHTSAGRYMCGEASAMLDALQGKRAIPRSRPPHAETCGLWGKPTVVNNVETLCCVPHIVSRGAQWFRDLSFTEDGGTKIYGVSGNVKRPGLWELPMGTSVREILEEHAGGMKEGYRFRGLLPGGASSDFIVDEHLDARMDFTNMVKTGSRLGTGTMIVMDDRTCPVGMMGSLQDFFARESCGWCVPCREGLPWVAKTLAAIESGDGRSEDMDVLDMHVRLVKIGNTFCTLAPGAMMPLHGALKYFRADFEKHIANKRCPWS